MKTRVTILALICVLVLGIATYAVYGNSDFDLTNDPLVSLSYLNEVFWPRVQEAIEEAGGFVDYEDKETEETEETYIPEEPPVEENNFAYEVLNLAKGDILLAETPIELILRSGSANAYLSGSESGIADLTAGVDLAEGTPVTANHLLLVPRGGDGRGLIVTSDSVYVMVRGGYTVVEE